jgi:hypothetical protein
MVRRTKLLSDTACRCDLELVPLPVPERQRIRLEPLGLGDGKHSGRIHTAAQQDYSLSLRRTSHRLLEATPDRPGHDPDAAADVLRYLHLDRLGLNRVHDIVGYLRRNALAKHAFIAVRPEVVLE